MDSLAGFLDGPRARGAFVQRSVLEPPWALRIADEAPLTVAVAERGTAWVVPDGLPPVRLGQGDIVLVRGPEHYTMADDPATTPQVIIGPGQVCTDPDGVMLADSMTLGVRTWGNHPDGSAVLLTGTYQGLGEIGRRLIDALPRAITLPHGSPVADLLAVEIGRDAPGQTVVLDRLLDLLVVTALREWFGRAEVAQPAWWSAHSDGVVGPAMRLLEHNPEQPWTVASLADAVGISRAALARRFTQLVGESPIAFLTAYRLALAADLLAEPDATVGQVSRRVGYASPFTFSTAFKRRFGTSPAHFVRDANSQS